jgi:hypothetical protein
LKISRAVCGDVTPIAAGTVAIERIADAAVGVRDTALAVPIHGLFVYAGRRAARAPIGEIRMAGFVVRISGGPTVNP